MSVLCLCPVCVVFVLWLRCVCAVSVLCLLCLRLLGMWWLLLVRARVCIGCVCVLSTGSMSASMGSGEQLTAVGFEPTPFRTGALSQRLRPLGQTVLMQSTNMEFKELGHLQRSSNQGARWPPGRLHGCGPQPLPLSPAAPAPGPCSCLALPLLCFAASSFVLRGVGGGVLGGGAAGGGPPPLPLPFPKLRSCCSAEAAWSSNLAI